MSADETDRLQALHAEGRDLNQFWVSPRLGRLSSRASMIVLARVAKTGRVHTTLTTLCYMYTLRVKWQIDFRYVSIVWYVQYEREHSVPEPLSWPRAGVRVAVRR